MSGVLSLFPGGPIVQLKHDVPNATVSSPATATAQCMLDNAGHVTDTNGLSYDWLSGGLPSNYEVFATLNSGTLTFGTTGSWLNLGTTRQWWITQSAVGVKSASITLQIRPVGGSVVATASLTLTAEVD